MDEQTKQKINNIISLVKQRKFLLDEINNLGEYKKKLDLVKTKYATKYAGKNGGSKTRRTKTTKRGK